MTTTSLPTPTPSENFREELRYLNKLYTEGLIDQDIFTNDYAQEIAKCSTGRALTFMMVNNSPVSNTPYEEYSFGFTEPLEGPNGDRRSACTVCPLPIAASS